MCPADEPALAPAARSEPRCGHSAMCHMRHKPRRDVPNPAHRSNDAAGRDSDSTVCAASQRLSSAFVISVCRRRLSSAFVICVCRRPRGHRVGRPAVRSPPPRGRGAARRGRSRRSRPRRASPPRPPEEAREAAGRTNETGRHVRDAQSDAGTWGRPQLLRGNRPPGPYRPTPAIPTLRTLRRPVTHRQPPRHSSNHLRPNHRPPCRPRQAIRQPPSRQRYAIRRRPTIRPHRRRPHHLRTHRHPHNRHPLRQRPRRHRRDHCSPNRHRSSRRPTTRRHARSGLASRPRARCAALSR